MSTIIVPAAGQSTRFAGTRPKYLLTHPQGNTMLYHSLRGIKLAGVDRLVVTILKAADEQYGAAAVLIDELKKIHPAVEILILDNQTSSQVETILKTIELKQITGQIHINDTDNYFECDLPEGNAVTVVDLHKHTGKVNVANKSYVKINDFDLIDNITEKFILSNLFCCGLYSFENAADLAKFAVWGKAFGDKPQCEYLSQIIYAMILNGGMYYKKDDILFRFKANYAQNYFDWGTIEDWKIYISRFKTLFIDFDGVLIESGGKLDKHSRSNFVPLHKNVQRLRELSAGGFCQIVITTARAWSDHDLIAEFCAKNEIDLHGIVCDCWHACRELVNDFNNTTSIFPSASAVNLVRNSQELERYI